MADSGIFWDAAAFIMDVCAFTARQMDNAVDDQSAEGMFPAAAPEPRYSNSTFQIGGGPAWSDGCIVLPWTAWRRYGDGAIIERNWRAMNRYMDFILRNNPGYLWQTQRGLDVGDDDYELDKTPKSLIATAYWAHSAKLLGEMAEAIGRTQDAARLHALFALIRQAFNVSFVKTDGTVGTGSQDCQVLALHFGLLPEKTRKSVAERLAMDVRRRGISLTTGILGTQFLLDALTDAGYADLAYGLLLRPNYPSWGYMFSRGATTIWESWSGKEAASDDAHTVSQNHFVFGSVCGFLFRRIAGIDAATPGFETINVRPVFDPRVKSGGGDYASVMGLISTNWTQNSDGSFLIKVAIPANASAYIHLPVLGTSQIYESGVDITRRHDMKVTNCGSNTAVVAIGSGRYEFVVTR
jgi:alpha-L-rhamnosidase